MNVDKDAAGIGVRVRPWGIFALQQLLIIASGIATLRTIRALTGHNVHGAADSIGVFEALSILSLYGSHLGLTVWLYRWTKADVAGPMGLRLSWQRTVQFAAGTLVAFVLYGWPWFVSLATGQARIVDSVARHGREAAALQVGFWLVALVINSVVEELTNRAFPMRVLVGYGLLVRVLAPSVIFALFHLADEPFRMGAFVSRTLAGVTLSMAYAATGNVWLAAGIHTGINYAIIWHRGSWHAGALVMLDGAPVVSDGVVETGCAALAVAAYWFWKRRGRNAQGRARYRAGVVPVTCRNCL